MIVAVDGPRGSGRTTLARDLADRLGWEYFRVTEPWTDEQWATYLLIMRGPAVLDGGWLRAHPAPGDPDAVTARRTVERLFRLRGGLLVTPSVTWAAVVARHARAVAEVPEPPRFFSREAHVAAVDLAGRSRVARVPHVGVTADDRLETVRIVAGLARERAKLALEGRRSLTGAGTVHGAKLVLVGETVNAERGWVGRPFDRGPAAAYLDRCLDEAGVDERRVYVTNADLLFDAEVDVLKRGGPCAWVALGRSAGDRLTELGLPHRQLDHPAYRRRFLWGETAGYVEALKQAYAELGRIA